MLNVVFIIYSSSIFLNVDKVDLSMADFYV